MAGGTRVGTLAAARCTLAEGDWVSQIAAVTGDLEDGAQTAAKRALRRALKRVWGPNFGPVEHCSGAG